MNCVATGMQCSGVYFDDKSVSGGFVSVSALTSTVRSVQLQ